MRRPSVGTFILTLAISLLSKRTYRSSHASDGRRTLVAMTVPFDGAVIQEFRRDCIAAGAAIGPFKDNQLARVLEHVLVNGGDAEIAAQALAAKPRPAWVTEKLAG
jgi:hypothetical protein